MGEFRGVLPNHMVNPPAVPDVRPDLRAFHSSPSVLTGLLFR